MRAVHVVVPDRIDDPVRPSGGNTYDRHICRELEALGWSVHQHRVVGPWPERDGRSLRALENALERVPDDSVVLLDGLVASAAPEALVPQARRLRLVVLVHMPLGHLPEDHETRGREGAVLSAATALITTSAWARRRLLELYRLAADRVHIAQPGVEAADLSTPTASGSALLCVAAVIFAKGHDVLLDALEAISDLSWHCVCVGSLDREPGFAGALRRRSRDAGLGERLCFAGPQTASRLDCTYRAADVMVLASRAETYGMVITEALARGLPVIASDVGGLPEAVGHGATGARPGLLVPPEDPGALAAALRAWLGDVELRGRLREAACERRSSLPAWSVTASVIAEVLAVASR